MNYQCGAYRSRRDDSTWSPRCRGVATVNPRSKTSTTSRRSTRRNSSTGKDRMLLRDWLQVYCVVVACRLYFYLRQGGNVFAGFCLSVCLSVRRQDNSKSYERIFLKFWGYVGHGINYQWFNFGGDPAGILDSGLLWNFRYHCVKGGIKESMAKRRWWRHLANNIALAEVPAGYDCFLVYAVPLYILVCRKIFLLSETLHAIRWRKSRIWNHS